MKTRIILLLLVTLLLTVSLHPSYADIIEEPGIMDIVSGGGLPSGIIAMVGALVIGTIAIIRKFKK